MTPSSGFSLVELMVVLALVGLVVVMAPAGLLSQHAALSIESVAHNVADRVSRCSNQAQALQRTLQWGHAECAGVDTGKSDIQIRNRQTLLFLADGSSSGAQIEIFKQSTEPRFEPSNERFYIVQVDRITSLVTVFEKQFKQSHEQAL